MPVHRDLPSNAGRLPIMVRIPSLSAEPVPTNQTSRFRLPNLRVKPIQPPTPPPADVVTHRAMQEHTERESVTRVDARIVPTPERSSSHDEQATSSNGQSSVHGMMGTLRSVGMSMATVAVLGGALWLGLQLSEQKFAWPFAKPSAASTESTPREMASKVTASLEDPAPIDLGEPAPRAAEATARSNNPSQSPRLNSSPRLTVSMPTPASNGSAITSLESSTIPEPTRLGGGATTNAGVPTNMIEQTNYENATRSESTNPIELPKLPAANPSSSPNQQFDQKMSLSTRLNVIPAPTPEIQAQADQMTGRDQSPQADPDAPTVPDQLVPMNRAPRNAERRPEVASDELFDANPAQEQRRSPPVARFDPNYAYEKSSGASKRNRSRVSVRGVVTDRSAN